jgi:hypothetical protein
MTSRPARLPAFGQELHRRRGLAAFRSVRRKLELTSRLRAVIRRRRAVLYRASLRSRHGLQASKVTHIEGNQVMGSVNP